jgi:hypothetical protein
MQRGLYFALMAVAVFAAVAALAFRALGWQRTPTQQMTTEGHDTVVAGVDQIPPTPSLPVLDSAAATKTIAGKSGSGIWKYSLAELRRKHLIYVPPLTPPLREIRDKLAARGENGDAAATQLYQYMETCIWMKSLAADVDPLANVVPAGADRADLPDDQRARAQCYLNLRDEQLQFAQDNADSCAGMDNELTDRNLYASALQAAKLGDPDAANAYVRGAVQYLIPEGETFDVVGGPPAHNPQDPEIAAQYKANALDVAESGITRGDWNMVSALMAGYSNHDWFLSFRLADPNPVLAYRYRRLWTLGTAGPGQVRREAETSLDTNGLTSEQVQAADEWAQETYQRYFAEIPKPREPGIGVCECEVSNVHRQSVGQRWPSPACCVGAAQGAQRQSRLARIVRSEGGSGLRP